MIKTLKILSLTFLIALMPFASFAQKNSKQGSESLANIVARTDSSILVHISFADKGKIFGCLNLKEVSHKQPDFKQKASEIKTSMSLTNAKEYEKGNYFVFENALPYKGDFSINGLKAETAYKLVLYYSNEKSDSKKDISLEFTTFAKEPKRQGILSFTKINETSITLGLKPGDGSRQLLLVGPSTSEEMPEDGKEYKPNVQFAKGEATSDKESKFFAVYFDKSPAKKMTNITVSGLKAGTSYMFYLCDANGNGETINYLTTKKDRMNFYKRATLPVAPIALEATDVKGTSCLTHWRGSDGTKTYVLDIATDREFKNILPDYGGLDVGITEMFPLEDLPESSKVFYFRVKAVGENGETEYSNIIEINMK